MHEKKPPFTNVLVNSSPGFFCANCLNEILLILLCARLNYVLDVQILSWHSKEGEPLDSSCGLCHVHMCKLSDHVPKLNA